MSYKIVRRNSLGVIIDEEIHKFLAWRYQWVIDDHNYIIPRYSYVTPDGRKGNDIYIMGKEDVEFVPLDDCTYEEAERILKDVKKKD